MRDRRRVRVPLELEITTRSPAIRITRTPPNASPTPSKRGGSAGECSCSNARGVPPTETTPNSCGPDSTSEGASALPLGSNADSYNHPNAAIEPRIPGIFQYYSVAEDELAKGYAGQYASAQETADAIAAAWEKITDQIGRDGQIALYKASLGM